MSKYSGSITMVDVSDLGDFSVKLTPNLPLSVSYNPDDNTYSPDWESNNLIVTSVVHYAGRQLTPDTSRLTFSWKKQINSGEIKDVKSQDGEWADDNILTVESNQFIESTIIVTYICTVTYKDPNISQQLTAEDRITFSLIKQPSALKTCTITGNTVFKYASDQITVNPGSIELTATLNNVINGNWQYKNSAGRWTDFNPIQNGTTITINAVEDDNIFNSNVAVIRKLTSDPNTFDIHTIVKLYDGVAGKDLYAAVLDNEDQVIPCNKNGTPTIDLGTIQATFTVYKGGEVDTGWDYSIPSVPASVSNLISGTWDSEYHKWTLNTWKNDAPDAVTITFTATPKSSHPDYSKLTPLTRYLQLAKVKTGADGASPVYYELVCSAIAVNRNIDNGYTPDKVVFSANRIEGTTKTPYRGYVTIFENGGGQNRGGQMSDATTPIFTYKPSSGNTLQYLDVKLYQTSGDGDILDRQTVVVTNDGEYALNIVLGNTHESITCDADGKVIKNTTVTIPYTGYKGTRRQGCQITTADISGAPSGCTIPSESIIEDDGLHPGSITLQFAAGSTLSDLNNGEITLTFTIDGTRLTMAFSWSKTIAGANAVTVQCYGKNGDLIRNDSGNITLTALLLDNGIPASSSISSYQWAKYNGTSYVSMSGKTSQDCTITPDDVDGTASFECTIVYKNKSYKGYTTIRDMTDPLQVQVFSSLGEQILNHVGVGAVYARTILNGTEVDGLKTLTFSTTAPRADLNSYYYKLDTENKTATLMKSNGTSWSVAPSSDNPKFSYVWTFIGENGQATTYNGNSTVNGKVLYLDSNLINNKIVMNVQVTG